MAKRESGADVYLRVDLNDDRTGVERGDDEPFVILAVGDFSGRGDAAGAERTMAIDRDNFDAVMRRLAPCWEGTLAAPPGVAGVAANLSFAELDDFHPDRIAARVPALRALLETRAALSSPSRFEAAAAEVERWAGRSVASIPTATPAPSRPAASDSALLGEILDAAAPSAAPAPAAATRSDLQRWVAEIVGPHVVRVDVRRQAELVAAVDAALSAQVRAIMHEARFQHLEASWRSLWSLVTSLDDDVTLKVRILDCGKEVLRRALVGEEEGLPALLQRLRDGAAGDGVPRPALLLGNFAIDAGDDELELLVALGTLAHRLGGILVAGAGPGLLGCASFTELPSGRELSARFASAQYARWRGLRSDPRGGRVALALPRLLCRLPYGTGTEPAETFAFEEWTDSSPHDELLWGNPAFAVATVVARAFAADGWSLDPAGEVHQLEGLPLFVHEEDGVTVTTPCAEVLLPDSLLEALEEQGFTPLVSQRGGDVVALPCLQVLSLPRAPLRVR